MVVYLICFNDYVLAPYSSAMCPLENPCMFPCVQKRWFLSLVVGPLLRFSPFPYFPTHRSLTDQKYYLWKISYCISPSFVFVLGYIMYRSSLSPNRWIFPLIETGVCSLVCSFVIMLFCWFLFSFLSSQSFLILLWIVFDFFSFLWYPTHFFRTFIGNFPSFSIFCVVEN